MSWTIFEESQYQHASLRGFADAFQQHFRNWRDPKTRSSWQSPPPGSLIKLAGDFDAIVRDSPPFETGVVNLPINLSRILYSMPQFGDRQWAEESRRLFNAMALHLGNAAQRECWLGPQQIGNGLYGLQRHADSAASQAVLKAIALHLESAAQRKVWLDTQAIGNGLYGLKEHSRSEASQAVLNAMALHLESAAQRADWLDTQAIGNGLDGLQQHTSSAATEKILKAIRIHGEEPAKPFLPRSVPE